jgi:hypothetical protein
LKYVIFIVTVCIVLAAPIELHPADALHVADSCQNPHWCLNGHRNNRTSIADNCTLLLWVLTKLFALSNNAATSVKLNDSVSFATQQESFFSFDTSIQSRAGSTNSLAISS